MNSVAIIDDNRLAREALVSVFDEPEDMAVISATAAPDIQALKICDPSIVLVKVGCYSGNSLPTIKDLRGALPIAGLVVFDVLPAQEEIVDFVNSGVRGFALKEASAAELLGTVRAVAAGATILPPELTTRLFAQIAKAAINHERAAAIEAVRMTPREREVIHHIGGGKSNKEIAEALNIATHTVKSHVRNVMEKLALHTRLQIAAYAHKQHS